jgi:hypothetical protein
MQTPLPSGEIWNLFSFAGGDRAGDGRRIRRPDHHLARVPGVDGGTGKESAPKSAKNSVCGKNSRTR